MYVYIGEEVDIVDGEEMPGVSYTDGIGPGTCWPKDVNSWFYETEGVITVCEYNESDDIILRHAVLHLTDIVYNTGKYTEEELTAMDQEEIIELAKNMGYPIDDSGTKAEIIAAFLEAQEAAG